MTVTLPLVLVLGTFAWLAIRFLGVRFWVAAVIALFGFYLAQTWIAPAIDHTTHSGVDIVNGNRK